MARNEGISVIVCCYNSADRILPTLNHLFNQKTPDHLDWEIILIDNNSSDDTASISRKAYENSGVLIPFRIIHESNPGLSYARQAGFQASAYEIALMVDDDNWLAENYLTGIWNSFRSNSSVGMVGGLGIPKLNIEPPSWFEKYAYCYATGHQTKSGMAGPATELYGAGLALKLSILDKIRSCGFTSLLSDRTGNALISGGDTELCIAFKIAGYDLLYNPDLSFQHELPASRINWKYLRRLFRGFGISKVGIDIYASCLNQQEKPTNGKLPFWFNRVLFLSKNILTDLPILFLSLFSKLEGNHSLLVALAKLGHIQGLYMRRKTLIHDYDRVFELSKWLSK